MHMRHVLNGLYPGTIFQEMFTWMLAPPHPSCLKGPRISVMHGVQGVEYV